jgi:hypothetical protein
MDWKAGCLAPLRTTGGGVWRGKRKEGMCYECKGKVAEQLLLPPEVTLGGAHGFKGKGYTFERWPQNI